MSDLLRTWLRRGGVDRAVSFSVATQLIRFITGPITLVLVLRHLTPEAQGYYYTFAGVVAVQVFLEMGFSQNIVQFAAHEFSTLHFNARGAVEGDPAAFSRLLSLGRLAFAYYAVAALLLVAVLALGGDWFFRNSGSHGVDWHRPWWIVAVASGASLFLNPAWSLLEGCGQIARVAQFRCWLAIGSGLVTAAALVAGAGLFTPALMASFSLLVSAAWLLTAWRPFLAQFLQRPAGPRLSWRREIWPFQWRIAISWMSGYFIFDLVNPLAFRLCGPVEAGRLGVSFTLVRTIMSVALMWLSTRVPQFGGMVARGAWPELDALWRRSTVQALGVLGLGLAMLLGGLPLLAWLFPALAHRLAPAPVFAWLGVAAVVQTTVSALAFLLRAHRREPFTGVSVLAAVLAVVLMIPLTRAFGLAGLSAGYALAAILAAGPAAWVFRVCRLEFRRAP